MADVLNVARTDDNVDRAELIEEISRLRAEVARLEQRIEDLDQLAHHDSLVPLLNRRGFTRQLEKLIDRTNRYGDGGAILFIDVDGLKMVNDSFGHHAGDAALVHLAKLLINDVRQSDCVGRFGGDEFAVLLERADFIQASDTASRLADRIAGSEFRCDGQPIPLSAAIGIAMIEHGDCAEQVLIRADRAMYEDKAAA
ncbi:diguanylate cyclase [Sphingomonas sp. KRR8]|uniref:GGDEF domain-containing protein n=1 Tax=Sphingomonas sp. KRR8 TaxID=2942996 RepID=UPI002021C6CE|nr:diguanylate cyclase [Sphingomonas sp. KRR8]URD60402.1 diguanylate cyclase [Sphingomonas sp. KRR8]